MEAYPRVEHVLLQGLIPVFVATNSIATPPGWDASPSQAFQAFRQVSLTVCWYLFIFLGGGSHCESRVSCPITQHNYSARARTRTSRVGVQRANHLASASPTRYSARSLFCLQAKRCVDEWP